MKRLKLILTITMFTLVFSFFNTQSINAIDNFEILELDVEMNINEDGTYDVVEKYKINYFLPALGIYRDIPTTYTMNFFDEENNRDIVKKYYMPITNIKLEGDVYRVETETNGERIVVGPDEGARITGEKDYTISYTINTTSIDLPDMKEAFFQNLVSGWDAKIHKFSATVNFYQPVQVDQLVVRTNQANSDNELNVVCNSLSDKSFKCEFDSTAVFGSNGGITAYVPLSEDFFNRPIRTSNSIVAYISSMIALVISIIVYLRYRNQFIQIEKVSFKPPVGFNSPMVAYVYSNHLQSKVIYGLLFEWANQGFIKIIHDKDKEENDTISFQKITDITPERELFEVELFNSMFTNEEIVTPEDWQKTQVNEAVINASVKLRGLVKSKGQIYDRKSQTMMIISIIITIILMAFSFTSVFTQVMISPSRSIVITVVSTILFTIINLISVGVSYSYRHILKNKQANVTTIIGILLSVGTMLGVMVFVKSIIQVKVAIMPILLYTFIGSLAINIAGKTYSKTEYGTDLMSEILGLRTFIKYAKKDELLKMITINPMLYYDVLPYAYAFGYTDIWLDKFEGISIPVSPNYTSTTMLNNYYFYRLLTSSMNRVPVNVMPPMSQSKGGGSFSSGGFSGGGFSGGGGFGGGGGGGR